MEVNIFELPPNSIMVEDSVSVVVKSSSKHRTRIERISGLLAGAKFKSVDLQHKAKEWWSNVSD